MDPLYLEGTYRGSDVIQIADAPYSEDTCLEQQFVNYAEQQAN